MKIRKTKIELTVDNKKMKPVILDLDAPAIVYYIENTDYAKKLAKGLTEEENSMRLLNRTIMAYFDAAFEDLEALTAKDPKAAYQLRKIYGLNTPRQTDNTDQD